MRSEKSQGNYKIKSRYCRNKTRSTHAFYQCRRHGNVSPPIPTDQLDKGTTINPRPRKEPTVLFIMSVLIVETLQDELALLPDPMCMLECIYSAISNDGYEYRLFHLSFREQKQKFILWIASKIVDRLNLNLIVWSTWVQIIQQSTFMDCTDGGPPSLEKTMYSQIHTAVYKLYLLQL